MFSYRFEEILKLFGTGSRFESINRGVLDIRDLYYYLSIIGVFLALNVFALEKLKWSSAATSGAQKVAHKTATVVLSLLVANLVIGNIWLEQTSVLRADLTQGNIYSISDATEGVLEQLQEPLVIRGYFSEKTHPLLSPLVPQIRDIIEEYEVVGKGKVRAEFINPKDEPELEEEANSKYNIKPLPFQISDKYQASLVNSYFDLLIQYGDQFEVLGFRDLIEVKPSDQEVEVKLKNPEYDITRSIKKVLSGFQNTDNLFATLAKPVTFKGFISSAEALPEQLQEFVAPVNEVLGELKEGSEGKFNYELMDPASGGPDFQQNLLDQYGFRPMSASLFDQNRFYFYMLLDDGDKQVAVQLPENLTKSGIETSLQTSLQRYSTGFLKTVGFYADVERPNPMMAQMGMPQNGGKNFRIVKNKLEENHQLRDVALENGLVPESVDILYIAAPKEVDQKKLFALDQFLMRGGTVILASSPFFVSQGQTGLSATKQKTGLEDWLKSHGIIVEEKLVLDTQFEQFPVPVQRKVGPFSVQEMKMVNYPMFVDIREGGLNEDISITSGVPQVTMKWASPILVDKEKQKESSREFKPLLYSSSRSWTTDNEDIQPDMSLGELGFKVGADQKKHLLGALVEGQFTSYFADKDSPLLKQEEQAGKEEPAEAKKEEDEDTVFANLISKSPDSARLILLASNEFIEDSTLQISASLGTGSYLNGVQLVENAIDWSLEDRALLGIRGRGHFSRTLRPLEETDMRFYEYLNYILVLLGLCAVYFVYRTKRSNSRAKFNQILNPA